MSHILAISFDCPSSPSVLLKTPPANDQNKQECFGRGFAWYNNEELSATIVKETKFPTRAALLNTLQDFSKFHSTIFIGHIRGAAKRLVQKDTQPFGKSYAGKDWIFVHSGDLKADYAASIPLNKDASFEPLGSTDSEHVFCYLLEKIKDNGARSLADVAWPTILSWLTEINKLGTANFIMSDGLDTIIYHDMNSFNQLYWLRSHPQHQFTHFETDLFTIDITAPLDIHHTFVLISNQKVNQKFTAMMPGQLMVLRRGSMLWNSADYQDLTTPPKEEKIPPMKKQFIESPGIIPPPTAILQQQELIDYVMDAERKFYSVFHETIYRYDNLVELSKHLFHLYPVWDRIQTVRKYKLFVSAPGQGEYFEDVFGNITASYNINSSYNELIIRSEGIVSIADDPAHKSEYLHQRRDIPLLWLPWQRQMMSPYLIPTELPESEMSVLIEYAMSFVKKNDYDLMAVLNDINQTIYKDYKYVPGSTSLATTPYELYMTRRGVCQDFTNMFICLARLLNVPARYRIGYIFSEGNHSNIVQSYASHAWAEVYLPYIGWYGLDPTNGCIAGINHIRVSCGRNHIDASPTLGAIYKGGGDEELKIRVNVNEIKGSI